VTAAIGGVNAAAITPRREGPEIDLAAMFDLIDFLVAAGVQGIALLGATGEFLHFDMEERIRLVALAAKRSRVPVLAGVSHSTFDGALALARKAADAGVEAILLMPPYPSRYAQDDLREFYLSFARELRGATGILLYNLPSLATGIACDTAIELLSTGQFAGIKDSSGDAESFKRLRAARDAHPFALLIGRDALFPGARRAGADGVVSGTACAVPELMLALDHAIVSERVDKAARLEARLAEFLAWADQFPAPQAIRHALGARGLKTGPGAAPLAAERERKLAEFREWFRGWLPEVRKECAGG
jgi:4-hydroxy-tetrahydrodipicolinate synthase